MKAYTKQVLLFLLPVIVLLVAMEILLRQIPNDYLYKKNYLDEHSKSVQVLFLGNSHAFYDINPDYIDYKSFNAAYVSQSLKYDLAILKKYSGKWESLQYIVLSVDYLSLFSTLETSTEGWRVKNYNAYCGMDSVLDVADNLEVLRYAFNINFQRLSDYYLKNNTGISCSNLGWGNNFNSKNGQDLAVTGRAAARRHFAGTDKYCAGNLSILKSILQIAAAKNIEVILFTCPACKSYVDNLDRHQLDETLGEIKKLSAAFKNSMYINLLSDKEFSEKEFYDGDHLNEIGARRLTLKIDSSIVKFERAKKAHSYS